MILGRYNLIGVETRFILDEYENLNPTSDNVTTDQLIGAFGTKVFDFQKGKILYREDDAKRLFTLFRQLQMGEGKQTRFDNPNIPKNLAFDLSPKKNVPAAPNSNRKYHRNDKVNVVYQNGSRLENVKYKQVEADILSGKCRIVHF